MSVFTSGHEGVATFSQDLHEVVSEITAGQVQTHDGVRKSIALVNGHVVGDTITRIKNNTCTKLNARSDKFFVDLKLNVLCFFFPNGEQQTADLLCVQRHRGIAPPE